MRSEVPLEKRSWVNHTMEKKGRRQRVSIAAGLEQFDYQVVSETVEEGPYERLKSSKGKHDRNDSGSCTDFLTEKGNDLLWSRPKNRLGDDKQHCRVSCQPRFLMDRIYRSAEIDTE